jgi:hypothetical protein
MHDSKKLLDQAKRQLASSTNTPTEAGPTASKPLPDKSAVIDAINRMFAEFELVYHNQYNKAFANAEKLSYAKKLWFSNLCHIPPEQITAACHRAIRESEFLPTIKGILKYCEPDDQALGLPDPHSAYVEACRAPSTKNRIPLVPPCGLPRWTQKRLVFSGKQYRAAGLPGLQAPLPGAVRAGAQRSHTRTPAPRGAPRTGGKASGTGRTAPSHAGNAQ